MVNKYKTESLSFEKLKELKNKINNFHKEKSSKFNDILADRCHQEGLKYSEVIDIQGKKKTIKERTVSSDDFKNLQPFHWDFAFNEVINQGGFDVIMTNPPWEKVKIEDKEFFKKYDNNIEKKNTSEDQIKKIKAKLLNKPEIKKDYLKTKEVDQFQRDYFKKSYQYQTGKIINEDGSEKKGSSDGDTYRIFVERCFELLNQEGFLGMVIPSGLHKDDGTVGLRREYIFSITSQDRRY